MTTAPSTAAATAASDFQSFLKLLTAQLRNQDPTAPLDSTQFVEQLASFSAVEQQIETNKLLKELNAGMTQSGLETATLWIGKDIEVQSDIVHFAGEPLNFSLPPGAEGEIVVRNSSNEIIYKKAVQQGQADFTWNGERTDGTTAAYSDYVIQIEKSNGEGGVKKTPVNAVARVMEARMVEGIVGLILDNGAIVEPGEIKAVRAPAAAQS